MSPIRNQNGNENPLRSSGRVDGNGVENAVNYEQLLVKVNATLTIEGTRDTFVSFQFKMSRQYDSVIYVKEFRDWFIRAFSVGCSDGFDAEDVTQLLKMDKVPGSDPIGGIFGVKVEEAIRLKFAHDKSLWMNKYRGLNLLVALNSTYNDLINSVDIVPTWVEMSKTTFVQSIGKMRHLIKTFRSICPDYFQNDAFLLLAQMYSTGKENFDEFKSALDLATAKKNIMWYENTDLICEIYENMVNAESNAKEFINSFHVTPNRKRDRNDDQEKQARIGGKLKKKKKDIQKIKCFKCGQRGHLKRDCPYKQSGTRKKGSSCEPNKCTT